MTRSPFSEWVEAEDTYSLSAVNTLQEAVNTIIKFLGLGPANLSEKVPEGAATHTLLCSGEFHLIHVETTVIDLSTYIRRHI